VITRLATAAALRRQADPVSVALADLIEFHRREKKAHVVEDVRRDEGFFG